MFVSTAAILHDPADNEPPDSDNKSGLSQNTSLIERNSCMCPVPPRGVLKGPNAVVSRDPSETNQATSERKEGGFLRQMGSYLPDAATWAGIGSFLGIKKLTLDDAPNKTKDVETKRRTKRRALLVGISYTSPWNTWPPLDEPHGDVDQYRDLLVSEYSHVYSIRFPLTLVDTYGYRPEDIVVLKDLPEFPEQSKPTRVNMVREIRLHVCHSY